MKSPIEIYTATEKKKVKEFLLSEQSGNCLITGTPIQGAKAVLDHRHDDECLVRGVLHRSVNSCLGVVENSWKRHMNWWYDKELSEFLRELADFLEREQDTRYRHDAWIKKVCTEFSKLNEASKKSMLEFLGSPQGSNATERKKLFRKAVLSKKFTYEGLMKEIKERGL